MCTCACLPGDIQTDDIVVNGYQYAAEHVHHTRPFWEHSKQIFPEAWPLLWILVLQLQAQDVTLHVDAQDIIVQMSVQGVILLVHTRCVIWNVM